MSESNKEPLGTVASKLEALDAELTRAVAKARWRSTVGLVVAVAVTLATGIYLLIAYLRFGEVDPQFAVQYTQQQLVSYMPEAERALKQQLHDQEDELMDRGERRLRALPDQLAELVKSNLSKAIDEHMPDIEQQVYVVMKDEMGKDRTAQPGVDAEKQFRAVMDDLAETVNKQVGVVYRDYLLASGDPVLYLGELAEGKNLDRRQQLQRNMLQAFFVLAKIHDEQPNGDAAATQPGGKL
jgi:hypothetical protein